MCSVYPCALYVYVCESVLELCMITLWGANKQTNAALLLLHLFFNVDVYFYV